MKRSNSSMHLRLYHRKMIVPVVDLTFRSYTKWIHKYINRTASTLVGESPEMVVRVLQVIRLVPTDAKKKPSWGVNVILYRLY